jgi:NAD(P)-dependent dehydrogenase (short-subunit alcohol dehydrogenase family)
VLLENRNAVVYGAAGTVGGAVARAFAREGAAVYLAGRTRASLDAVADRIRADGGIAEAEAVDALDEEAVDRYVDGIAERAGGIDVSFNAVRHGDVHGIPLMDMRLDDFAGPIVDAIRAQFLTSRAAARHMVPRRSGVIMAITAMTARAVIPEVGGTGISFDAIESQSRQWAAELGPHGVRVVWFQTTGIEEAIAHIEQFPAYGTGAPMTRDELLTWLRRATMLDRLTTLDDVANAAVFLASDHAAAITAASLNVTAGGVPGR